MLVKVLNPFLKKKKSLPDLRSPLKDLTSCHCREGTEMSTERVFKPQYLCDSKVLIVIQHLKLFDRSSQ